MIEMFRAYRQNLANIKLEESLERDKIIRKYGEVASQLWKNGKYRKDDAINITAAKLTGIPYNPEDLEQQLGLLENKELYEKFIKNWFKVQEVVSRLKVMGGLPYYQGKNCPNDCFENTSLTKKPKKNWKELMLVGIVTGLVLSPIPISFYVWYQRHKDSDEDGLSNWDEKHKFHTNYLKYDTDDDGLSDSEEVNIYHTNPSLPDTDYDGLPDRFEACGPYADVLNPLVSNINDKVTLYGIEKNISSTVIKYLRASGENLTDLKKNYIDYLANLEGDMRDKFFTSNDIDGDNFSNYFEWINREEIGGLYNPFVPNRVFIISVDGFGGWVGINEADLKDMGLTEINLIKVIAREDEARILIPQKFSQTIDLLKNVTTQNDFVWILNQCHSYVIYGGNEDKNIEWWSREVEKLSCKAIIYLSMECGAAKIIHHIPCSGSTPRILIGANENKSGALITPILKY
ncbi:MAG: hypothetical protein QXW78_02385, partial [Candidatus Thermoplasmatota archaeon]